MKIKYQLLAILLLFPLTVTAQLKLGLPSQISLGVNGAIPDGSSGSPAISANGRYLTFRSDAPNLINSDGNHSSDIFIKDLKNGNLSLASISTSGVQGDDSSTEPASSSTLPDGLYAVAFSSSSTNLGPWVNSSHINNIFIRFPTLSRTVLVTFGVGSVNANDDSNSPSISLSSTPDRAYVTYTSKATNLVTYDTHGVSNIFLSSVYPPTSNDQLPSQLVTTELISKAPDGTPGNGESGESRISGDGKWIVFSSNAGNLLGSESTIFKQIFLYGVDSGKIVLVSKDAQGHGGNNNSFQPVISYSGRYIAYVTQAPSIVSDLQTGKQALVVFDRLTGVTKRVNTSDAGVPGDGFAKDPSISANGRFISFSDTSSNLVSGDVNGVADIFVKDLSSNTIALASSGSNGLGNAASDTAFVAFTAYNSLSELISFRSFASNLSSTTDGGGDIFLSGAQTTTPVLNKSTRIETPEDVSLSGKKVTISAQAFSLTAGRAASLISTRASAQIRYDIRIEGIGSRKKDRFQLISARNSVSMKNLKPGTYVSRYRTTTVKGNKTVTATGFSPQIRFRVP